MKSLARREIPQPAVLSLDHHDLAFITGGTAAPPAPGVASQAPADEPAQAPVAPAGQPGPGAGAGPRRGTLGCDGHRSGRRGRRRRG